MEGDREGIYAIGITKKGEEKHFPLNKGTIEIFKLHKSTFGILLRNDYAERGKSFLIPPLSSLTPIQREEYENKLLEYDDDLLVELRVPNSDYIKIISCDSNLLESIDVSHLKNLNQLNCSGNLLKEIKLPEGIRHLYCHFNKLEELYISNSMKGLECHGNDIKTLSVPKDIMTLKCDKTVKGLDNLFDVEKQLTGIELV